jgi:hypothetical protein
VEAIRMAETNTFTFKINDFTPETMPFGRLVEYYSEIKKMLGLASNLHLTDIFESSHGSAFKVDPGSEKDLVSRVIALNEGTAPKKAVTAFSTVNKMLRDDNTSAIFSDSKNDNVIEFPGKLVENDQLYSIRDAATFTGELYHISGSSDGMARVRVSTDSYGVVFCRTSRDIGKELRDFLFENVRISGRGTWHRMRDGKWEIDDFQITDFAPVTTDGLKASVDRIRNSGIEWPDDPIGAINKIEEKEQQVH